MGVSKVVYGSNTLIDLTADTITAADLMQGVTAHGADGEAITGSYVPSTETETLLWTNPNPTASTFAGQDVTLSQSIDSFKELKVKYLFSYNSSALIVRYFKFPVWDEDETEYAFPSGMSKYRAAFGHTNSSGNTYARAIFINNATSIHFTSCNRFNASGTANGNDIPLEIYGIK